MDKFSFLRAQNWQEVMHNPKKLDSEIYSFLKKQNKTADNYLKSTKKLNDNLFNEIKNTIQENYQSLKIPNGNYSYFEKNKKGLQHPIIYRKKNKTAVKKYRAEQILDINKLAQKHDFFATASISVSPNNKFLAYSADTVGSETYTIYIKEILSKQIVAKIDKTTGHFIWQNNKTIIFSINDNNFRPYKINSLNIKTKELKHVYTEKDPKLTLGLQKTEDDKYVLIESATHDENSILFLDKTGKPREIIQKKDGVVYSISHRNGFWYILSNDNAKDFKIIKMNVKTKIQNIFIPNKKNRMIMDFSMYSNFMAIQVQQDSFSKIMIWDFNTNKHYFIPNTLSLYEIYFSSYLDYKKNTLRYAIDSPINPLRVYEINTKTREIKLKKTRRIKGFNAINYVTKRVFVTARDNKKIPMTITYKKNSINKKNAPCLMYGYGAYGYSSLASFKTSILPLLNRGFIYVIAHTRGGMEMGYDWYLDGKKFNKKNTFYDFLDCANYLIDNHYTSSGNISAYGGSAGGMLMGVIVNINPKIWKSIIAVVPFVDNLNTMMDTSLPLTPIEWKEWGNPKKDKKAYKYIKSYSVYDNVKKANFPNILAVTSLSDVRVTYWEPAKWIAKLQQYNLSKSSILLKTKMREGHAGKSGRYDSIKATVLNWVFLLKTYGISK